ncbi:MAG: hypothetical protein G01um101420_659 [Parcubacteria group bacterium Gr01-1014_20]|nr:MAG: hypothetical protein G01um101420_659 [Parcubacteria group bacterium Gr01-1014_20]
MQPLFDPVPFTVENVVIVLIIFAVVGGGGLLLSRLFKPASKEKNGEH